MQVDPSFVTLELLKRSSEDGPRKAGFVPGKGEGLGGQSACGGLLGWSSIADRFLAAANHHHVGGHGDVHGGRKTIDTVSIHWKPASSIEQITRLVVDRGQLQPLHGALVSGIERSVVFKRQGGGAALVERLRQLHSHGEILRHALWG